MSFTKTQLKPFPSISLISCTQYYDMDMKTAIKISGKRQKKNEENQRESANVRG